MSTLYIPNSIGIHNFDSIFKQNNDFSFSDKKVSISFHPSYLAMHPIGLAFYAALGDYIKINSIEKEAKIVKSIPSIPYLQRMGLFSVLGFQGPSEYKPHEETGRFMPLRKIHNSTELDNFLKDLDPILHTSQNNTRVIKHVFSELLRNVLEHSQSPLGGNVCVTYNKKHSRIGLGISDAGIGILSGMRGYKYFSSHKDAILAALTPGISGTTKHIGGTEENAGAGLFYTKCIAQATRNHFLIYSGNSYYKLCSTPNNKAVEFHGDPNEDYKTLKDKLPIFNGTLIGMDIHIEETEAFSNLLSRIGASYQLNVKKVRKEYYKRIKFI